MPVVLEREVEAPRPEVVPDPEALIQEARRRTRRRRLAFATVLAAFVAAAVVIAEVVGFGGSPSPLRSAALSPALAPRY
jgi:hypothetical protein